MKAERLAPIFSGPLAGQPFERSFVATFLDHTPDSFHFKDRDGRFLAVSRSRLKRNGVQTEDEILGRTDFDFICASDARRAKADEDEILRTGNPLLDKLEHVTWTDGRETWSLINKMPLRDELGQIIGTFGTTRDVTAFKRMELAFEQTRRDLLDASRLAGQAEVTTGVLHNVGNVLNSLNVSATVISSGLRQGKIENLGKVAGMLEAHRSDFADFLTQDPKGKLVPEYLSTLARHLEDDRTRLLKEIASLQRNVDHIKEIVALQQSCAKTGGVVEPHDLSLLIEDALRMNGSALVRHDIRVVREFIAVPAVLVDRGKILQILGNLITNAKYAADAGNQSEKLVTLGLLPGSPGHVRLTVKDNGIGIPADNLPRIFQHGFTTKQTGHGFGLHSSAAAAAEMNGTLTVHSDGPGTGATFTLELPLPDSV